MVVIEPLFSIVFKVLNLTLSAKVHILWFHGFNDRLYSIFVLVHDRFHRQQEQKVDKYGFLVRLIIIFVDLQTINITLRILYRPEAQILPKIYTNLGLDYEERVLPSITNEVLKSVVVSWCQSMNSFDRSCSRLNLMQLNWLHNVHLFHNVSMNY